MQRHVRRQLILALTLLALLAASSTITAQELAREGTFEGNWQVEGRSSTVEVDGHEVFLMRTEGPVSVKTSGGLGTAFESDCVGVSDGEAGGTGRCVRTDA